MTAPTISRTRAQAGAGASPPAGGDGRDGDQRGAGAAAAGPALEALFAEARRRRRRIRLAGAGALLVLAVIGLALSLAWPGHRAGRHPGGTVPAGRHAGLRSRPGTSLVWVTYDGQVIIGNLATLALRSVAEADAEPSVPLVPARGLVYWVKQSGGFVDGAFWPRAVEALNPRTGTSTIVAPGEFIFPSATGRRIYVSTTDESVGELPSRPGQRLVQLALPRGWYLPAGAGLSVANGITVMSADAPIPARPAELAVWNPGTGRVRPIGRAEGAISAYTPPGAGYSLLAWMPANCRFPSCPITITNTATLASRTLRSPLGHGFVLGGALSPDGRYLAVFVNVSAEAGGQPAELAIASTQTGRVRLVPAVRMTVGEDADWIRWLPGGGALVAQANRDYLVNAVTLAAKPFRFNGNDQQGINFSAELIPAAG